jgi:hypothetical protein
MQPSEAFQAWSSERDRVDAEMNALFTTDLLAAPEERQVRKMRFMALVERRDAAARGLLEPVRQSTSQFRARTRPKAPEPPVAKQQSQEVVRPPEPSTDPLPAPNAPEQRPMPAAAPVVPDRIAALMHSLFS